MNDMDFAMCSDLVTAPRPASAPRVLLAEDDPASSRFLADGLCQMGALVTTCGHGLRALERARAESFDLLLLDCRMPGAGALAILAGLRADPQAASHTSVAVATSAETGPDGGRALYAAGFSSILRKPCTLAQLQQILWLIPAAHRACLLDEAAGLRNSGDNATLRALRQLLRAELTALDQQLDALWHDPQRLAERLHRLRASCGFCGADDLAGVAAELQQETKQRQPTAATVARFRGMLQATWHALRDQEPGR
jgi:CheY-like chemotaxis protein